MYIDPISEQTLSEAELALALAEQFYGAGAQIQRYLSDNNPVFRLSFLDGQPDRVIKLGTRQPESVLREQGVIRKLDTLGFQVPKLELTQVDLAASSPPFMIMPKIGDSSLLGACIGNVEWAGQYCEYAGQFAACLSQVSPSELGLEPIVGAREYELEQWSEVAAYLSARSLLSAAFEQVMSEAKELLYAEKNWVVHGDFNPNQVLIGEKCDFAVIDWEAVAAGRPVQDFATFVAGIKLWGGGQQKHIDQFVAGFLRQQPLSEREQAEADVWQRYHLLKLAVLYTKWERADEADQCLQLAQPEDSKLN